MIMDPIAALFATLHTFRFWVPPRGSNLPRLLSGRIGALLRLRFHRSLMT
jgi:hypothetical protein